MKMQVTGFSGRIRKYDQVHTYEQLNSWVELNSLLWTENLLILRSLSFSYGHWTTSFLKLYEDYFITLKKRMHFFEKEDAFISFKSPLLFLFPPAYLLQGLAFVNLQ